MKIDNKNNLSRDSLSHEAIKIIGLYFQDNLERFQKVKYNMQSNKYEKNVDFIKPE